MAPGFVSEACQVSKESLSTTESLKRIENGLKYFNNQSQHILKLIKGPSQASHFAKDLHAVPGHCIFTTDQLE